MTWRPTQPNGWNPRLSRLGDRIFVLYGAGEVHAAELTLDLQLIREHVLARGGAFPMGWIRPGRATWQVEDGQDRAARFEAGPDNWDPPDLMADDRGAAAGNLGVADGGHWATWLAKPHFRTVIDGLEVARPSGGALAMAWPWVAFASTNDNLFVRRFRDGSFVPPDLPTAVPMNFLTVGRQGHVAYGSATALHAIGPNGVDLGSQMIAPWHWEVPIRIVDINGTANLVTFSWDGTEAMFLIRPFGAKRAKVVRIWATNGDVLQVDDRLIVAGSGSRGELSVTAIPVDQPAEALAPKMEPLPKGYIAWWYDTGKYRPTDNRPPRRGTFTARGLYEDGDGVPVAGWERRMVQSIIDAGAGFVTADPDTLSVCGPIWDRVHGVWVHEPPNGEIDAACRAARAAVFAAGLTARPIILVIATDAVLAADYNPNNAADWVAPECYEPRDATVDDWVSATGRMTRLIDRILAATAPKPVILAGQAYDRRQDVDRPPAGFSAEALEAYQPATFAAWRNNPSRVLGVGLFSDLRPGGAVDHPEIYGWAAAAVTASPGLPAVPVLGPGGGTGQGGHVAPKVTIEGTWPVRVEVEAGAKARVRAVAKVTAGTVDRFDWRIRPVGGSWTVVARNPAFDTDHHFSVGVGEYQIGLDAIGVDGKDSTGADRRIIVTTKVVSQPDPDPKPDPGHVDGDVTVRFLAPNGTHYLTALNGGGWPGEDFRGQPAGLVTASVPARDVGGWQDFVLRGGKRKGTFGLRSVNAGWVTLQADNRLVANVHAATDYVPDGRQAFILVDLGGGKLGIQGANGKFLAAINAGGGDVIMDRDTGKDWERWTPSDTIAIPALEPGAAEPPPSRIAGRLRVESGRLRDDAGFVNYQGLSTFSLIGHVLQGRRDEAIRQIRRAARAGRNALRVFAMLDPLRNGFGPVTTFHPDIAGWDDAADSVVGEAAAVGLRSQINIFADCTTQFGGAGLFLAHDERRRILRKVGARFKDNPAVWFRLANEAYQNGWSAGDDPKLLELADELADIIGHRDFGISDVGDDGSESGSQQQRDRIARIAQHCRFGLSHPDRAEPQDGRVRTVEHLEAIWETFQAAAPDQWLEFDEPRGFASGFQPGRRDNRPAVAVGEACTAAVLGCGVTYHHIAEQDDATPGLDEARIALTIPTSPDFRYRNANLGGSWIGPVPPWDKIRPAHNGTVGVAAAIGDERGPITPADGWVIETDRDYDIESGEGGQRVYFRLTHGRRR